MNNWAIEYTKTLAPGFFVCQVAVIGALFVIGFIICLSCINSGNRPVERNPQTSQKGTDEKAQPGLLFKTVLLSFPVGMSAFILLAYAFLIAGVPYNSVNVSVAAIVILALLIYRGYKNNAFDIIRTKTGQRFLLGVLIVVSVTACFATSGIMPLSLSNDSMYYFHEYPKDIVYFGMLRDQFDTFLTDTGLGSVVIDTLPFLFGFNESFGIREFMHINFLIYFVYRTYILILPIVTRSVSPQGERTNNESGWKGDKAARIAAIVALLIGIILATSSPVWILGHWAMANMYFMEFFFMSALEAFYCRSENHDIRIVAILSVACALIRIEGGVFMLLLVLCFTFLGYSGKELSLNILIPMLIMTSAYAIKIFMSYTIDNPYTFLTPEKAILQAVAMTAVILYVLFIKDRLPVSLIKFMPEVLTTGLILLNGLLLLRNRELYVLNLRAFYGNLMGQSGWGMLPHLTMAALIVVAFLYVEAKLSKRIVKTADGCVAISITKYMSVLALGFAFVTVAVSYMRGDPLNVQVGDSGNRVLLQIAPLLIFAIVCIFVKVLDTRENE